MSSHDLLIIVLFIGILVSFTPFLGKWLASVLMGRLTWLSPVLGPVERCVYRMAGVDPTREMDWKKYLTTDIAKERLPEDVVEDLRDGMDFFSEKDLFAFLENYSS